jgi:predicted transcriptional regulator
VDTGAGSILLVKKEVVRRFIKKHKTSDTSRILNEVNIDYDTLMLVLADLRKEG